MLRCLTAWLVMGLLLAAGVQAQRVIYVKKDATGANDGSSWADAYTSLQDALAAAQPGDEIWVAAGVYYPDEGEGLSDNDRTLSFRMKSGVEIYGGFAGTEADRSERDWETNRTVLSGDLDQNDLDTDGDGIYDVLRGNNAYHVVVAQNVDSTGVLDGFIIRQGLADGNRPFNRGGGVYIWEINPTLRNLIILSNSADLGGGVHIGQHGKVTLKKVTIADNSANTGGGVSIEGSVTMEQVTIANNMAVAGMGGGVYIGGRQGGAMLKNVMISRNLAFNGGGIYTWGRDVTLMQVAIVNNSASGRGGGAFLDGSSTLMDITIVNNSASEWGGGVFIRGNSTLREVKVTRNSALDGGGMYISGSVMLEDATIVNNSVSNWGGGVFIRYQVGSTLADVTIANNSASRGGGYVFVKVRQYNSHQYPLLRKSRNESGRWDL